MAPFFCIFHALSFELNFFFDRRFPLSRSISVNIGLSNKFDNGLPYKL